MSEDDVVVIPIRLFPRVVTWRDQLHAETRRRLIEMHFSMQIGLALDEPGLVDRATQIRDYIDADYLVPYAEWEYGGEA